MAKDPVAPPRGIAGGGATPLEWIRGARDGDPAALDAWFRHEHPVVYRLCFGFLADAAEAEDLAQDAMLHLHDRLPDWDENRWDEHRGYGAWRDTLVLNLCRDRLRRLGARSRVHREAAQAALEARGPAAANEAPADGPHERLERAELRDVLRETLAALSPREREVFVLRDLEGENTEATAERLDIQPSSVRSILTLARRRVRARLEARFGGLVPGEEPRG